METAAAAASTGTIEVVNKKLKEDLEASRNAAKQYQTDFEASQAKLTKAEKDLQTTKTNLENQSKVP